MKTIKTNVYTFDELTTESAKDKARDWFRDRQHFDGEETIEDAKQCFANCGYEIDRVYFSGFSSQGDGACFEGKWRAKEAKDGEKRMKGHAGKDEELHRIAKECERIAGLFPNVYLKVEHSGHYSHQYCTDFTIHIPDDNGDEIDTPEREQAEKDLIKVSRAAMVWIYRQLEKEYEYENSNEYVDETILANEYTFTADGERFG